MIPSNPAPRTFLGVQFVCWRTGPNSIEWRSEDDRLRVGRRPSRSTYYADVDGVRLCNPATGKARRFLSLPAAMEAAVQTSRNMI